MIDAALRDILDNDAPITAIVVSRIYATLIPLDATLPAISFNQVSEYPIPALTADTDIRSARFQIDAIASTYDDVITLGAAIITALQRYQGTNATVVILDIEYSNRVNFYDSGSDNFRDTLDFIITYRA